MPELDMFGRPMVHWDGNTLYLEQKRYGTGHLRLDLVNDIGEPWTTASHNVPEAELPPNHICIKTWRENRGLLEALISAGVVRWTGQTVESGNEDAALCELLIPITAPEIEGRSVGQLKGDFMGLIGHIMGPLLDDPLELHAAPGRSAGRIHGQSIDPITNRQHPALAAQYNALNLAAGKLTREEAWGLGVCANCKQSVNVETDFRDDLSRKEYNITAECQNCQDRFFT